MSPSTRSKPVRIASARSSRRSSVHRLRSIAVPEYSRGSATGGFDALHDRPPAPGDPGRRVAERAALAAVVREARALARPEGEVDHPARGIDQPPVALAAVLELHGLEAGVVAAGEVEVGLRGH